jgi:hypothetical protein
VADKLILILHNEKEFKISLKNLTIKDTEKLNAKLRKSFSISKQNKNSSPSTIGG